MNSTIGFTLAGFGFKPFTASRLPWNVSSVTAIWHFSLLKVMLLALQKSSTFFTVGKFDFESVPKSLWCPWRFLHCAYFRKCDIPFYGIFRGLTISQTVIFGSYIYHPMLWGCINWSFLRPIEAGSIILLNSLAWKKNCFWNFRHYLSMFW